MIRFLLTVLCGLFLLIGQSACGIKMYQCNWAPVGKAEIIYTAAFFTGAGVLVGWIDIKDE
jgi:hypothetical protein